MDNVSLEINIHYVNIHVPLWPWQWFSALNESIFMPWLMNSALRSTFPSLIFWFTSLTKDLCCSKDYTTSQWWIPFFLKFSVLFQINESVNWNKRGDVNYRLYASFNVNRGTQDITCKAWLVFNAKIKWVKFHLLSWKFD